jgi:hypothetical protein
LDFRKARIFSFMRVLSLSFNVFDKTQIYEV